MAYILGTKNVADAKNDLKNPYGLVFPISSQFNVSYDKVQQAKSNLINLLRTRPGERIMQPLFGVRLLELLFEPNDEFLEIRIQEELNTAINYWLPYIKIESLDIDASDYLKDRNMVMVNMRYSVESSLEIQSITFTVSDNPNLADYNNNIDIKFTDDQIDRQYAAAGVDFFPNVD
jgi:phage baseplate assembly protein W